VQKRGTFTHATGSTSAFIAPICDCGQFAVLRIAATEKKCWKKILGLPNYKVKFIQLGLIQPLECYFKLIHCSILWFSSKQIRSGMVLGCNFFK